MEQEKTGAPEGMVEFTLTAEDEAILDRVWAQIAKEDRDKQSWGQNRPTRTY